jgi:hypothetical protein
VPKLSKEERAELESRLAADDADDDDGDEVTVSHGDKSVTGSYRRVKGIAKAWGLKLEDDPPPAAKDGEGDGKTVRFGRRTS